MVTATNAGRKRTRLEEFNWQAAHQTKVNRCLGQDASVAVTGEQRLLIGYYFATTGTKGSSGAALTLRVISEDSRPSVLARSTRLPEPPRRLWRMT